MIPFPLVYKILAPQHPLLQKCKVKFAKVRFYFLEFGAARLSRAAPNSNRLEPTHFAVQ
jgi:hypothetical protein